MIRDAALTGVLFPLLVWQALALRRRALRLPEASGPRSGVRGDGTPLRLLVIGDSSAAGVGAATQDDALVGQLSAALAERHTVQWQLIARTGATTRGMLDDLRHRDLPPADGVVIVLGVNDVTHGAPQHRWLADHAALRALLRQRCGARAIYVCAVPPLGTFPLLPHPLRYVLGRRAQRFDAALHAALACDPGSHHVPLPDTLGAADMAPDGFHPGPPIYAAWARHLAHRILSGGPSA